MALSILKRDLQLYTSQDTHDLNEAFLQENTFSIRIPPMNRAVVGIALNGCVAGATQQTRHLQRNLALTHTIPPSAPSRPSALPSGVHFHILPTLPWGVTLPWRGMLPSRGCGMAVGLRLAMRDTTVRGSILPPSARVRDLYRGTSLIRNTLLLRTSSSNIPRVVRWS